MQQRKSILDVRVVARLDLKKKGFVFEIQVFDDQGIDITDSIQFYARMRDSDMGREDLLDAVIIKKTN